MKIKKILENSWWGEPCFVHLQKNRFNPETAKKVTEEGKRAIESMRELFKQMGYDV